MNVRLGFLFLTSSVVADRLVLSSQRFNIDGQAVESYMLVRPAMLAHILPALADQKFGLSNLTGRGFVACLDFWDPTRPAMPAPHFTISVPNGWAVSGINGSICEPLVLLAHACLKRGQTSSICEKAGLFVFDFKAQHFRLTSKC